MRINHTFAIKVPNGLMTANLQPVLNAGSTPNICLPFIGGCSNRFLKFSLKHLLHDFQLFQLNQHGFHALSKGQLSVSSYL